MTEATRRQRVNKEGGGMACVCGGGAELKIKRREEGKVKGDWWGGRGEWLGEDGRGRREVVQFLEAWV